MNVVLTGSVATDYLMKFPGYFRDHILPDKLDSISLSFLAESMIVHRGGIAPNIGYTMALFGERPRVMATVGEDFGPYREFLESKGVDTSTAVVIPNVFSASFFCNTDRSNAQIASFYPGAMGYASQLSFHDLPAPRPDLVMVSPNDPVAMCKYVQECQEMRIPYIYDPSQQIVRLDSGEVKRGIEGARALFVNDYEFSLVKKITGLSPEEILQRVEFMVVTCGEEGANVYADGHVFSIPAVPPDHITDPTGVGDAFRGGFLAGLAHNLDWETCGHMGVLAATYCLEQAGPQSHDFTKMEFVSRYRLHFDDKKKLDVFIK